MSHSDRLSMAGPESRGAVILSETGLRHFLAQSVASAARDGALCGLVLTQLNDRRGRPASHDDLGQTAQMVSQLMRQRDAVAQLSGGLLGIVLHALDRRGDAHIMLERLESFARAAALPWTMAVGVGVYPLSGRSPEAIWDACLDDLKGAMSSETWEHYIPRDTLLTRSVG